MGTWDVGPFDNDAAGDFSDTLDKASENERERIIRDALVHAIDTHSHLDADISEKAVAAAALVATQCPTGEPASPHFGPEQPLPELSAGLREIAVQLSTVSSPSRPSSWNSGGNPTAALGWRASPNCETFSCRSLRENSSA
ncbi:DUF4259 domain-containing protein [Streptomyces lunaelactis]|uniref:DUF4259 domain-containing protein n=1 Tax=Streptomyces lunaelactis TaxID=1535768 RepID=UPI00281500EE|nr:DUF4259 domain-containing protein [Streptomyces lunaelactis]